MTRRGKTEFLAEFLIAVMRREKAEKLSFWTEFLLAATGAKGVHELQPILCASKLCDEEGVTVYRDEEGFPVVDITNQIW